MELVRIEDGLARDGWLREAFNDLFSDSGFGLSAPIADVVEDEQGYHFYLEMPGFTKDAIEVRADGDRLVMEAERKRPEWSDGAEILMAERRFGRIYRAFALPEDANREDIHASYKDGVLEVTIGKRPEAKPVKVKVEYQG
jgi:HSP20 family protein